MGFPKLPASFWTKSDLWDLPAESPRKKNKHASAWNMDRRADVRSLMSVRSDFEWLSTSHHELGHIYYYLAYNRDEVPPVLREGANRAFHEAIGELAALVTAQPSYLRSRGLLPKGQKVDPILWLLNDAMNSVAFLPFAAGTMAHWEHDLYEEDLPPDQWNARWWKYVAQYQGVVPPSPRDERFCDACTKTHIVDDPAGYYDYALATIIKFQVHEKIARDVLHADPRDANYYGSQAAGDMLRSLLAPGATRDWRELLREVTGSDLTGKPMLAYYQPLQKWLQKQNRGLRCELP
jgi:peptidyl-dipeptidase A